MGQWIDWKLPLTPTTTATKNLCLKKCIIPAKNLEYLIKYSNHNLEAKKTPTIQWI